MEYSIIIPAHNSARTVSNCIESIRNSKFYKSFEIIVVDDASSDDTPLIAERLSAKVIGNSKCAGPAQARNLGVRQAEGNILLFVDSDVLLFEDTLKKIDEFLSHHTNYAAVSCGFLPKCEMTDAISRYKHLYMCYCYLNQPESVSWLFTSTMAIKKEAFKSVGGFNEQARVIEDELLGKTLAEKGYSLAFAKDILVRHLHKYSLLDFMKIEISRSRAIIILRYLSFFKNAKYEQENIATNMIYSVALFPFLVAGIFLAKFNPLFLTVPLAVFFLVNAVFLWFCKKQFGFVFMLEATLILIFDSLLCCIGVFLGTLAFLGGKRV